MFNKLSPTPITNQTHRRLLIFSMIWFFSGAWIDSSAHTYLIDDIETFFTPWHGVLYSGYAFSVLVVMYIKNKMKDYKFDIGVLGYFWNRWSIRCYMAHTTWNRNWSRASYYPISSHVISRIISHVRLCFYYKTIKREFG